MMYCICDQITSSVAQGLQPQTGWKKLKYQQKGLIYCGSFRIWGLLFSAALRLGKDSLEKDAHGHLTLDFGCITHLKRFLNVCFVSLVSLTIVFLPPIQGTFEIVVPHKSSQHCITPIEVDCWFLGYIKAQWEAEPSVLRPLLFGTNSQI